MKRIMIIGIVTFALVALNSCGGSDKCNTCPQFKNTTTELL